ncbi:MAG: hypothetical protein M1814_003586 [Vezdaea aestivalis]|nr:MAG: hypothetical protein M1814_003586 [Vezdaea aestivalis]
MNRLASKVEINSNTSQFDPTIEPRLHWKPEALNDTIFPALAVFRQGGLSKLGDDLSEGDDLFNAGNSTTLAATYSPSFVSSLHFQESNSAIFNDFSSLPFSDVSIFSDDMSPWWPPDSMDSVSSCEWLDCLPALGRETRSGSMALVTTPSKQEHCGERMIQPLAPEYNTYAKASSGATRPDQRSQQNSKFICDKPGCGQSLKSERSLERHRKAVHLEGELFTCKNALAGCGYKRPRKDNLQRHERKCKWVRGKKVRKMQSPRSSSHGRQC